MIDVDELARFAAIPAPTGAEEARLQWLQQRLSRAPGTRRRDDSGNLIWSFGEGRPELLLMAHVDTVFAAATELAFTRDGDDLIGPGVGDNATAVIADGVGRWSTWRPQRGWRSRSPWARRGWATCAARARRARTCGRGAPSPSRATASITWSSTTSAARARITVSGPGGQLLVRPWHAERRPRADRTRRAAHGRRDGQHRPHLGGEAVNAIAAQAEMVVELRSLDDAELRRFEERVGGLAVMAPLRLEVEVVGRRGAGRVAAGDPLVRAVVEARRSIGLGNAFAAGSTDANAAAALGIPAVCIGCADGSGMHTPEERIDVRSLERGVAQLEAVLARAH